jgi:hypothetical protein
VVWQAGKYAGSDIISKSHAVIRIVYTSMQRQLRSISSESDSAVEDIEEAGEGSPLLNGFDNDGGAVPGS